MTPIFDKIQAPFYDPLTKIASARYMEKEIEAHVDSFQQIYIRRLNENASPVGVGRKITEEEWALSPVKRVWDVWREIRA